MGTAVMADDAGDVDVEVPLGQPTPARMYDYFLGGKDNFEVDRAAADALIDKLGVEKTRFVAQENRRFLWRAVEYLAGECGVSQFIDVGAGLPTMRNTHEIAQAVNPGARVVYVDNDPIVLSHGRALLAEDGATAIVTADMREPDAILDAPKTKELIDFTRPVGILLVAVFHFVVSAGHPRYVPGLADPAGIVAAFRDRIAPGSYVAVTHNSSDGASPADVAAAEDAYRSATAPMVIRSRSEVAALFEGWRLVPPGVVPAWQWHSDPDEAPCTGIILGGVAVKEK
jgi:SAM-dependent methyltransferase